MSFPYEWKILEWNVNPKQIKKPNAFIQVSYVIHSLFKQLSYDLSSNIKPDVRRFLYSRYFDEDLFKEEDVPHPSSWIL